ncbi:hypothetical protein CSC28_2781 [Pseudomonas paraeruginosa]|nr:hypothetical protein CSC28_2781 [Pseudomonas paraeruginosa]
MHCYKVTFAKIAYMCRWKCNFISSRRFDDEYRISGWFCRKKPGVPR